MQRSPSYPASTIILVLPVQICREEEDIEVLRRASAALGYMAHHSERLQRAMAKKRGVYSGISRVQKIMAKQKPDGTGAPDYMQELMEKLSPGLAKLIKKMGN